MGSVASGMASFSSHCPSSFSPLGSTKGESAGILPYHSVLVLLHLGISNTSGDLGVACLQPSLDISGKLCVSSCHMNSSSSSVQVSGRTFQRSTQTFDSGGTMVDGGFLASHSSQYDGRHSSVLSCWKRSCECFGRPDAQGSAISAFNILAAQG